MRLKKIKTKSGKIINLRHNLMFYRYNIKCDYCKEYFPLKEKKCPCCGAPKNDEI